MDEKLSLSPSEANINTILGVNDSKTKGANGVVSNNRTANEDEAYLKSLQVDLNDEDPVGGKIQQNLARKP